MDFYNVDATNLMAKYRSVPRPASRLEVYMTGDENEAMIRSEEELPDEDIPAFVQGKAPFHASRLVPDGDIRGGIRVVLQLLPCDAEISPVDVYTLSEKSYNDMLHALDMSYQVLDSSEVATSFYWSRVNGLAKGRKFQVVLRKGYLPRYRGNDWSLFLSYDLESRISTAYCKGIDAKRLAKSVKALEKCKPSHLIHPMLFPVIILSGEIGTRIEAKQLEAGLQIAQIERDIQSASEAYSTNGSRMPPVPLAAIRKSITKSHSALLFKRPLRYVQVASALRATLLEFFAAIPEGDRDMFRDAQTDLQERLDFIDAKLQALDYVVQKRLSTLQLSRELLQDLFDLDLFMRREREENSRLEESARELERQKKEDHDREEQREIKKQKAREASAHMTTVQNLLSVFGASFLPGTLVASICSTTFFNFRAGPGETVTASNFWIYWAFTMPLTLLSFFLLGLVQVRMKRKLDQTAKISNGKGRGSSWPV